ncbi:MAG: response regulator [Acidimicrobiales bacterium]
MVIAFARDDSSEFVQADRDAALAGAPFTNTSAAGGEQGEQVVRRVLIAEDDESMRSTLNEILTTVGYSVAEAGDGEAALATLTSEPVDILVLDLHMPRMDGMTLLQRIDPPPPVVLVHSAFEFYAPLELQRQVGPKVFRYLRKPVSPPQLMSALEDAVTELEGIDR